MEGSQQIRLRWTSHQGTVLSVFDALLSAETLVDVTLCADGQYVRAHKIILSACSPYFQEVLSLDFHKTPIIFLKDVKYSELKALVQYMYRGEVNIAQEELSSLLAVAQSLKIRGLAEVETSGNNMSSDTLIMPELNSSSHVSSKATSSSAGSMMNSTSQHSNMNAQLGLQQVTAHATTHSQHKQSPIHVTNISQPKQTVSHVSISSVPQQAKQTPESRSGTSSSSLPPPTKRLRTHQQTLEPVTVTITPSIPQSHSIPSQLYDSMPAASTYETQPPDQQETHFTDDDVVEQTEPMYPYTADDVKVEVEEGMGHVEHDVGDDEENDNSMSQSSFSDSWKHEEAHGSQSMMGGDGEMPGGSGAGQDLNASAGGDGEGNSMNSASLREMLYQPRRGRIPWILDGSFFQITSAGLPGTNVTSRACCNFCSKTIAGFGLQTSNFIKHLKNSHPQQYDAYLQYKELQEPQPSTSVTVTKHSDGYIGPKL